MPLEKADREPETKGQGYIEEVEDVAVAIRNTVTEKEKENTKLLNSIGMGPKIDIARPTGTFNHKIESTASGQRCGLLIQQENDFHASEPHVYGNNKPNTHDPCELEVIQA